PPVVLSRTLRTTGIGESALAALLAEDAQGLPGLPLAYNPKWQGTDLRFTARGLSRMAAERVLDEAVAKLYVRARRYIYGEEEADLAATVLDLARSRGMHIATAESCTGGLLGGRITAIPGSSDVYLGGVVAYEDDVKTRLLGVQVNTLREHGSVSEAVALEMAKGVRARIGGDLGVGITGTAGPGGGTAAKPVGLVWIAVSGDGPDRTFGRVYSGDREEIRLRATQSALDMIRRSLQRE
ncbi:MAG: nicotinamide-nucleotide amidohydrolase family protein, partial [Gemmatimonadota bacterium]|nr:nicotinamide-nucleotide amidohydrolase family protein [Gemmatimonadota bacterium]